MIKVIENKKQRGDKLKQNIVLAFTGIIDNINKMPYKAVTTIDLIDLIITFK